MKIQIRRDERAKHLPSAKRKSDALDDDDDDDDEAPPAKRVKNQAAKETPSGCEGSSGQLGT